MNDSAKEKVLMVIGDGGEVIDTMAPYHRLGEEFEVVTAGPEARIYHLVQHELAPDWDITVERPGYGLAADIAFRDVEPADYAGLVLPGGRAPEYLRYDADLMNVVRDFFAAEKPIASVCHGIEILAAADIIKGCEVTTIPKCRYDAEFSGGIYLDQPVTVSGNLVCAQGKKNISPWMKKFVKMIKEKT